RRAARARGALPTRASVPVARRRRSRRRVGSRARVGPRAARVTRPPELGRARGKDDNAAMFSAHSLATGVALAAALTLAVPPHGAQAPKPKGKGAPTPKTLAAKPKTPEPPAIELSAESYFKVADYDGDGFISFDEAQASMAFDSEMFRVYDTDNDGLISRE